MVITLDRPLVLDGALGTQLELAFSSELEKSNLNIQNHPLWSALVLLKKPQLIEAIHLAYLKAGADIITTSTYQASKCGLQKYGNLTDQEVSEIYASAVNVALGAKRTYQQEMADRNERAREIFINGSVGPYGGFLANGAEYTGEYGSITLNELIEFHRPIVETYIKNDLVDLIGFETVPNFEEVKAICQLIKSIPKKKHYYISFNFKDENHICDGTPISKVIEYVAANKTEDLICVGANCIQLSEATSIISNIFSVLATLSDVTLIIYPNAGLNYNLDTAKYTVDEVEASVWGQNCKNWINEYNAKIIGGCCGSGPRDVQIIRTAIDNFYS